MQAQVVILDHGLYRKIDDTLRLHYAGLWQALVVGDVPAIERHCAGMNAGDSVPLFAGLLTARSWANGTNARSLNHLALAGDDAERAELQVRGHSSLSSGMHPAMSRSMLRCDVAGPAYRPSLQADAAYMSSDHHITEHKDNECS